MAGLIVLTGFESATNTDILQGTRLQTFPSAGILTFEMQAADNVAANSYATSIQLPNGDTPLNGVLVPGGATAGLAGILDSRLSMQLRFQISQGGHCVFSVTETGDTEVFWRVTFKPIRPRGGQPLPPVYQPS